MSVTTIHGADLDAMHPDIREDTLAALVLVFTAVLRVDL